jgi:hypothetical protein
MTEERGRIVKLSQGSDMEEILFIMSRREERG